MTTLHRARAVIAALLLATATAACSQQKDTTLETRTVGEATSTVNDYLTQTLTLIGPDARQSKPGGTTDIPCSDAPNAPNDQFGVAGHYQIENPTEAPKATIARLQQAWQNKGYTQNDYRTSDPERPELTVTNPADHIKITAEVIKDAPRIALTIGTPCYHSPTPLY
ncbi:hypothetical protein AB0M46_49130 [Dactylosporangium sp. NPDC051485]|uniref:hypothetical protein n=1 Tax=Dactylosporangium sp. NPDC051485 TaxID=3154846 RepID=UPI00343A7DAE